MKKVILYTEDVLAEMVSRSPLNKEICSELAIWANDRFETDAFTARGFIAKCRSAEGVEYTNAATQVDKTGAATIRKPQIVAQIADTLGIEGVESLAKAGKADLKALLDAVQAFATEPEFAD